MKYGVKCLLPMSGSKIRALSSAQIERHSITNWCPVSLTGVNEGSKGKWSEQFNATRKPQGTKPKVSSFEFIITIVKGLLQHFCAPLVTSKIIWAWLLTRQKNEATCDDGVFSSLLVSRFCFCRHIASPGETWNVTSFTWEKIRTNGP